MFAFLKRLLRGRAAARQTVAGSLQEAAAGLRRAKAGLRESEEHFAQLVAEVRDYAVFLLDAQGHVRTWNTGAECIKGYRAEEIIGQHFSRFYPQEAIAQGWPAHELRVAAATGRFEDEGWRLRKDGSRFWANIVITALREASGEVRGFLKITRDLTERKQAEEQLRLSEARFRLLIEGVKDYAIFMLDPQGRVMTWNEGAQRIKGYTAEEIIGQHFARFYPRAVAESGWPEKELRRAAAEGRFEEESWRVRKDGSQFWANVVFTALRDEQGILRGFAKVTRDLTERRQAEENARRLLQEEAARKAAEAAAKEIDRQREQLHVTLQSIGDGVIATDAEGRVTLLNPVAEALTGWQSAEARAQPLQKVFPLVNEITRQPLENPVAKVLRDGSVVALANHTVLIARDSTERPIEDSAAPIRNQQGETLGVVLVFRDLTPRRSAERALRASEERWRTLADAMPQIVWTAGPDGVIDYSNRRWYEFSGLSAGVGNEGWGTILHPDDRPVASARWAESLRSGSAFEMELRLLDRRTGGYRWHLIRTVPVKDESGAVARWYGTSTDIHEQKRAGEVAWFLAEASAALAVLVDYESTLQKVVSLAVPYFADWSAVDVADEGGQLRRLAVAHQDAEKVRLAQELLRRYPPDLEAPGGIGYVFRTGRSETIEQVTDELLVKGAKDEEHLRLMRALGLRSYLCVPLVASGKTLGVLTFATAESGRIYTQADLKLAEDLAHRAAIAIENARLYRELKEADRRKDEFLATLAHELRNPLAPIRNSLQILKMPRVDAAAAERSRAMMERQVQHLVRLVDDLLDVSRVMRGKIELRKEGVELATVVARAIETAQPLIESQEHELSVHVPTESLPLEADPVRLAQVVANLLTNAAKYTEPGGRIGLTATREGNEAVLRVWDTGIGMAPEMLPKIFDLFVQVDSTPTRSQGGLGIGLTLVKNLVEMHHGTVEAHSAGLGQGSEFVVRLPLAAAQKEEPWAGSPEPAGPPPPAVPSSGRRLLVVDDNKDAAESLAVLLRLQGHEVQVAYDGLTALELLQTYRPELVFLDLGMPGLDGYEVARRLRQLPGLEQVRLAALTGWGQQADRRRTSAAGFTYHLVKPLEPKTLEELLSNLKPPRR